MQMCLTVIYLTMIMWTVSCASSTFGEYLRDFPDKMKKAFETVWKSIKTTFSFNVISRAINKKKKDYYIVENITTPFSSTRKPAIRTRVMTHKLPMLSLKSKFQELWTLQGTGPSSVEGLTKTNATDGNRRQAEYAPSNKKILRARRIRLPILLNPERLGIDEWNKPQIPRFASPGKYTFRRQIRVISAIGYLCLWPYCVLEDAYIISKWSRYIRLTRKQR